MESVLHYPAIHLKALVRQPGRRRQTGAPDDPRDGLALDIFRSRGCRPHEQPSRKSPSLWRAVAETKPRFPKRKRETVGRENPFAKGDLSFARERYFLNPCGSHYLLFQWVFPGLGLDLSRAESIHPVNAYKITILSLRWFGIRNGFTSIWKFDIKWTAVVLHQTKYT